jgi:hypothetical protein
VAVENADMGSRVEEVGMQANDKLGGDDIDFHRCRQGTLIYVPTSYVLGIDNIVSANHKAGYTRT